MESTRLSSSVTVTQYLSLRDAENTVGIADMLAERLKERYIEPFDNNPAKHGFSMMAVSCLLIEVLNSFKKGWKKTGTDSNKAFEIFFAESNYLKEFQGVSFYKNIRCGILHQAETYGGWRISRKGDLLSRESKIINAQKFFDKLKQELDDYISLLKTEPFTSIVWKRALKKFDYIASNCS